MKLLGLLLCALMLPTVANAEIYKWKDKDGVIRYSDVPPPSNIKLESLYGKKIQKPTGQLPLASVEGDSTAAINKNKAVTKSPVEKNKKDNFPLNRDQEASKRSKDADEQKKINDEKEAELKLKEDNCKVSKSNLATYTAGGRITKTNEKGERQFMGDADISQAKADAEKDVEKYCDN